MVDRRPWGIADCSIYPLFTDDLIQLMNRLIPSDQKDSIGHSIVIKARLQSQG